MLEWISSTHTWIALLEIIGINIVLSGDNAVVIALACRALPAQQQKQAIFFGSLGAIVLRVVLTIFAAALLQQSYLKLGGGVLLLWIAVKLLLPEDEAGDGVVDHAAMWPAIKTIIVADLVMSLDNVLGVAAAAKGDLVLLTFGLLVSMPLIIYGSTLIMHLMSRFPIIVTLGGALLGYVAGEMGVSDHAVEPWVLSHAPALHWIVPLACMGLVVLLGKVLARPLAQPVREIAVQDKES